MAVPESWSRNWRTCGTRAECSEVMETVQAALQEAGLGETAAFAVRLSLEEALANAVRHGHAGDAERPIDVSAEITGGVVRLEVADEGPGFDPTAVPDPTAEENLTIASGRGLSLIRAFMTDVEVVPPGNRIIMTYRVETSGGE
ncbi:MAG: ATP-binding protein [Phycisphaerales bacterium]|jgi:serine/threonine-protein kinase RsbW|nr:ATP-binding protein [Phycisphaerales bacterium]